MNTINKIASIALLMSLGGIVIGSDESNGSSAASPGQLYEEHHVFVTKYAEGEKGKAYYIPYNPNGTVGDLINTFRTKAQLADTDSVELRCLGELLKTNQLCKPLNQKLLKDGTALLAFIKRKNHN